MRTGPILIIEDDEDDQLLLREVLTELKVKNTLRFFTNGQQVLDYLNSTSEQPFVILCDVNMPIMSGLELRRQIDQSDFLKKKAVPFIFLTTDASPELVQQAYDATIQGFFRKASSYAALKEQMHWIVGYWLHCIHPHNQNRSNDRGL